MESVILVIHLFLALAIIGLVLIQRSEGGGLGIGGGGGGLGNLATARGVGNALTRATAFCAIAFFCTSLGLGIMARSDHEQRTSIYDALSEESMDAETPETDMKAESSDSEGMAKEEAGETGEDGEPPAVPIAE